jgi:hypothetical protein
MVATYEVLPSATLTSSVPPPQFLGDEHDGPMPLDYYVGDVNAEAR